LLERSSEQDIKTDSRRIGELEALAKRNANSMTEKSTAVNDIMKTLEKMNSVYSAHRGNQSTTLAEIKAQLRAAPHLGSDKFYLHQSNVLHTDDPLEVEWD